MIASFSQLVGVPAIPSMQEIKNLKMPQFSGMSFISKVLMFLNPANFCVLDQQIARLRNQPGVGYNILDNLVFGEQENQIRISALIKLFIMHGDINVPIFLPYISITVIGVPMLKGGSFS